MSYPRRAPFVAVVGVLPLVFGCQPANTGGRLDSPQGIYQTACARCHGADGRGGPASGPSALPPPNLTDPSLLAGKSDADLRQHITLGKGAMPGFAGVLSDEQITKVIQYVRSINRGGAAGGDASK